MPSAYNVEPISQQSSGGVIKLASLEPISPFLALIDRLISLIQARKTRRREYFEKIIDPLYAQFVPLGEDVLSLFRSAKISLDSHALHESSEFHELRGRRNKCADARARLTALARECRKHMAKKDSELADFVQSIELFFWPNVPDRTPQSSPAILVMRFFELEVFYLLKLENHAGEDDLRIWIGDAIEVMQRSWYEIAGRYMALKLKYTVD